MENKEKLLIIQHEIKKSITYIKSRGNKISMGEVMQELGNIKLKVQNLIEEK